jgi:hypothetical protein
MSADLPVPASCSSSSNVWLQRHVALSMSPCARVPARPSPTGVIVDVHMQLKFYRHSQFLYNEIFYCSFFGILGIFFCDFYERTNILNGFEQRVFTNNLPLPNH